MGEKQERKSFRVGGLVARVCSCWLAHGHDDMRG